MSPGKVPIRFLTLVFSLIHGDLTVARGPTARLVTPGPRVSAPSQGIRPASLRALVTRRSSALMNLIREARALVRRPCFVCAAATRALPSVVRGPVLFPPCIRQRSLPVSAGFLHGVPARVFARHRVPCHCGPNHVPRPAFNSLTLSTEINSPKVPCIGLSALWNPALPCGT